MAIKTPQKSIEEVMKNLNERAEASKKIEDKIRSSKEYICWLRDFLEDNESVDDFEIFYKKDELEEKTYENICNLAHFYSIIRDYWEKYKIPPTYIDYDFGGFVYKVYYEDMYFNISKVSYLEGFVTVQSAKRDSKAINYEDIMQDKEPKAYKEREKFIKEFRNKIKYYRKKAKKLDIDVKHLKKIIKKEFKS